MQVSELSIYPIKSIQGFQTSSAIVTPKGFNNDRQLMLVDSNGMFVTQRKHPELALVKLTQQANSFQLNAPQQPTISVSKRNFTQQTREVSIWDDQCIAKVADDATNLWFSQFLGFAVSLVAYHSNRPVDPNYSQAGDTVSFADGFPLLIISQASLDDLNQRLAAPVSMQRFRPNIVISGSQAFAEDNWQQIKIGSVIFDAVKRCSRCVLTTVDPETGQKDMNTEPLRTLGQYRRGDGGVYFGMNLIPRSTGTIKLNDKLSVLK
ncbi:MOSC domain-containing protein [Aliikangiella sp. IMCC44653]